MADDSGRNQVKAFKLSCCASYLLLGLEDVASEDVALSVSGDVAENLQILGVVRHVEYPGRRK